MHHPLFVNMVILARRYLWIIGVVEYKSRLFLVIFVLELSDIFLHTTL